MKFDTEDEVISKMNDNQYGLSSGVYTSNLSRGMRVSKAIRALIALETRIPLDRLLVYTPEDNPYWLSFILLITSSSVSNFITDNTGPNNSFSAVGRLWLSHSIIVGGK